MPNPARKRMTIRKLASLCGVSVGTVSAVLNNRSTVSEETRMKVLDTIRRTGYRRNPWAKKLQDQDAGYIAVIASQELNIYEDSNLKTLVNQLTRRGQHVYLITAPERCVCELPLLPADAYVFLHTYPQRGLNIIQPYLIFDPPSFYSRQKDEIVIYPDREAGGRLAAQYFIKKGCRHFVSLHGRGRGSVKWEGFRQELQRHGIDAVSRVRCTELTSLPDDSAFCTGIWADGMRTALSFMIHAARRGWEHGKDYLLAYWGNPSQEFIEFRGVISIGTATGDFAEQLMGILQNGRPGDFPLMPAVLHND